MMAEVISRYGDKAYTSQIQAICHWEELDGLMVGTLIMHIGAQDETVGLEEIPRWLYRRS